MTLRVLHLVGSAVSDFHADLSRLYAQDCLQATADPARYEVVIAYVTPDRQWRFPTGFDGPALAAAAPVDVSQALARLAAAGIDVAVPQMFCLPGMTTYRALFDLLGIPYVGNAPDVMALGANKARARAVVASAGVAVPPGEVLRPGDVPTIAAPAVIKPVDTDNSLGVTLARTRADYAAGLQGAFVHSGSALVESYVELGREVRCGIVERDGELVCLPLEEYQVDSARKPIRDYADKLARGGDGELSLTSKDPSRSWILATDDPVTEVVWAAARSCHSALGCRDYSLFDFRIDPDGRPWFLEAGLYCSFARTSVVAVMAAAAGIALPDLFASSLTQATRRG